MKVKNKNSHKKLKQNFCRKTLVLKRFNTSSKDR